MSNLINTCNNHKQSHRRTSVVKASAGAAQAVLGGSSRSAAANDGKARRLICVD